MAAFELAVEGEGAEGLELDLHRTRDDVVVVLHDPTLDRTTDGYGRIVERSLEEVRALDAGHGFCDLEGDHSWRGRGVRVPTLTEVLERFPGTWLSLDLKAGDPRTERSTVDLLRRFDARSRVVLGAEDPRAAARLRDLAPEFEHFFDRRAARLFYLRHRLRSWWGYRTHARSLQIPFRHGSRSLATARLVRDARARDVAVRYWTVNDETEMETLIDLGVDGIITDDPARLTRILERRGLR